MIKLKYLNNIARYRNSSFSSSFSKSVVCNSSLTGFQQTLSSRFSSLISPWKISLSSFSSSLSFNRKKTVFESQRRNFANLNEIVKLDLLEKEDTKKITSIWLQYHRKKDCLSAVIPKETYHLLLDKSKDCPLFVFPLSREKGYVSILAHMQLNQNGKCLFSSLKDYQSNPSSYVPWINVSYFRELELSKGIVLMRAEIDPKMIKISEAQYLVNLWQLYMLDESRYQKVKQFNHDPKSFDFNQVIEDVQTVPSLANFNSNPNNSFSSSSSSSPS